MRTPYVISHAFPHFGLRRFPPINSLEVYAAICNSFWAYLLCALFALEALRDALYKSTTTITTTAAMAIVYG